MDRIIITGITGQCAGYLAEKLLASKKQVIGVKRRSSTNNLWRIKHLLDDPYFELVEGDVTDLSSIISLIKNFRPDQIYNTAAQSHVHTSFHEPNHTMDVTGKGVLNLLEGIRLEKPDTKFLQFSTSELFGKEIEDDGSQNETTRMAPQSPYSIAKLAGYHYTRLYRDSYDIFASNMIMFNCESPRRGEEFVTRKITKWVGEFYNWRKKFTNEDTMIESSLGNDKDMKMWEIVSETKDGQKILSTFPKLRLGNISASRDWGYAGDYMDGAICILNHKEPDDFVIATGETHTVEDFLKEAFSVIGIKNYTDYFLIDKEFYRPAEVPYLKGDASKIKQIIGWKPQTSFKELVRKMVQADVNS
jgi:GDPmannose 4,6-dehydratase